MIRALLASAILWPLYIAVSLALDVIGLALIGLMVLACHERYKVRPSKYFPWSVTVWPFGWLTWLWGNEEDGVTGPSWWLMRTGYATGTLGQRMRSTFRWSALRNPSNNLRFIPGINPRIDMGRVRSREWFARPGLFQGAWFVWQGLYAGLWVWLSFRGQTYRAIVGWKLKPEDGRRHPDADDPRAVRVGFGLQFKRVSP
jgi:hypothetical protein